MLLDQKKLLLAISLAVNEAIFSSLCEYTEIKHYNPGLPYGYVEDWIYRIVDDNIELRKTTFPKNVTYFAFPLADPECFAKITETVTIVEELVESGVLTRDG